MTINLQNSIAEAIAEANSERNSENEYDDGCESTTSFEVAGDEYLDFLCGIFGVN